MEYFHRQYSMCYNPIPDNIYHHHLKNGVDTQLTVALHTLNMNWVYYTKDLKISIRNSLLLYTIIQINDTLPLYQLLFINAMKPQLTLARNQIFNLHTYTLFNLISVNAQVEFIFNETLLTKIMTIRKFQKNFFLIFQVLGFKTLFVLVTPLQFPLTKKEAHQSPQKRLILLHTTSSCWRLMTFCPHPSLHWYWHQQYRSQFAKCKHQPSSRWRNPAHSHSLWTRQIILPSPTAFTNCLHPPPLPRVQVTFTCT